MEYTINNVVNSGKPNNISSPSHHHVFFGLASPNEQMVGLLSFPHYGHISFKTLGLKTVVRGGDLLFLLVDNFHMGVMENGTMMMDVSYVQDEAFHYI